MVIFADKTDDSRHSTEYSVCILFIPKRLNFESAGILHFYLYLGFPDEVQSCVTVLPVLTLSRPIPVLVTVSDAVAEVCRSFHIIQGAVRVFAHDSAPYMTTAAERLQPEGVHVAGCFLEKMLRPYHLWYRMPPQAAGAGQGGGAQVPAPTQPNRTVRNAAYCQQQQSLQCATGSLAASTECTVWNTGVTA